MRSYYILAFLLAVLAVGAGVLYQLTLPTPVNNTTPVNNDTDGGGLIMISDGDVIPNSICTGKGIKDKVLVIHATGCGACAIAVPILEELEQEMDVAFEFIDMAHQEGRDRLIELGFAPYKVPTLVIGCNVYVGVKSKDKYRSLIEELI